MSQTYLPLFVDEKRMDGFFYDPISDFIHFIKSMNGKKVKFSTKVKRPFHKKAKEEANRKLKELFGDKRISVQPLIKDETPKWVLVKQSENLDHRTMQKIYQGLKRIEPFWGDKFPKEVDADSFAAWLAWLDNKYPGQQKFNSLKQFKGLCRYMNSKQHEGYALLPAIPRMVDPDQKKNIAARKKKTERILTTKEFRKICKVANDTENLAAHIMYKMATRVEETLEMQFGEQVIQAPGGWRYVWSIDQNKADLEGAHDFPDSLRALLKKRHAKGIKRLFPQERDVTKALKPQQINWDDWRDRAKLGWHWTSKTFRHTCLSHLFSDPKHAQAVICSQYRVSLAVAMSTYVKATKNSIRRLKNASDAWA